MKRDKPIKIVMIRVSEDFAKVLDIERNMLTERMSRELFTQKKAEEFKEQLYKLKRTRGFMDDFKI